MGNNMPIVLKSLSLKRNLSKEKTPTPNFDPDCIITSEENKDTVTDTITGSITDTITQNKYSAHEKNTLMAKNAYDSPKNSTRTKTLV